MGVRDADRPSATGFPTTHWGRVLAVGGEGPCAREALAALCRDYWYPLYGFVRRKGHSPEDAQDLVQGLFAELLGRGALLELDPARGRFRSFLMACCSRSIARHHARERAQKRGGGLIIVPIDRGEAESRLGGEPAHDETPERLFERQWAATLLERVLANVDAEMARSNRRALYERLRPGLLGQDDAPPYREVAAELCLTEGAVKAAAHRLRSLYRKRVREEVARTVADPADIDAECDALLAILAT
jgi:RNA polymerase sigma-70 factor (ECF subfamily)